MRRAAGALLLSALAACSSGGGRDVRPSDVADACAIFRDNPHWVKPTADAARRWGAPPEVKLAIIWRESTFRRDARPPGRVSSAYGYSQAIDGTWDWYRRETGNRRADRTEYEDAIDFVGWYMAKTRSMNGLSPHDAFNQYLAYHEGHTGYKRGDWRGKPFLIRAASQVDQQARRYREQLRRCGDRVS
jgi:hypothetical protein